MVMNMTRDTLFDIQRMVGQRLKEQAGSNGSIERLYNIAFGDINYDLQRPAKQTEVFWFPILNMMPHVQGNGGDRTNFKVIDQINTAFVEGWVPEGARQQRIASHLTDKSALYASFGLEDAITDEAKGASFNFEDAMGRMQTNLMLETQRRLERAVAWGNGTLALGTPTAPTLGDVGTGGNFHFNTQYFVGVIAVTPYGLEYAQAQAAPAVPRPTTYTAPDGKTVVNGFGASAISSLTNITLANDSNNTHSITATTPAVVGAAGYVWFVGTANSHVYAMAISTINSVVLTTVPNTGHQDGVAFTVDYSNAAQTYSGVVNSAFDGLLTLAVANGQVITQATGTAGQGTGLTADGAGGIVEIENLLQTIFDKTRVGVKYLVVSSQEARNIRNKVIAGGSAPVFRFNMDAGNAAPVTAGRVIGDYLNMFTVGGGELIKLIMHPYCPKGTILGFTDTLPGEIIPNNNIGQLFEFHLPSPDDDIHATLWPRTTREYQSGVYMRGAVAHYYPQSMGVVTNIGNA